MINSYSINGESTLLNLAIDDSADLILVYPRLTSGRILLVERIAYSLKIEEVNLAEII